jgi:hypothetical protein
MARTWKPSRPPDAPRAPTTLQEICRRYYACAVTLAKVMGLPLSERFLREHRESISCCFIESGRAGVQVPAGVTLPPLAAEAPMASTTGQGEETSADTPVKPPVDQSANGHAIPTCIPADGDLPCRGQEIGALKPAQLAMLLSKVASLVHAEGDSWVPLLHALQAERQARVAQGQRLVRTPGPTS